MGMGSSGGKGGGQATSNGQPVYYDSSKGQYYTLGSSSNMSGLGGIFPWAMLSNNNQRNYLGSSLNNASGNFQQSTVEPQVYQSSYNNYSQPGVNGDAFNNGVNSDSGIAAILAGLYNSGVFNQQQVNPYAPNGTVGSWTGIPYGQQQESMFARRDLNGQRHGYGGYQGQDWNPYGNYYTASNTNNNVAPPPNATGPDALSQLNYMMQNNQNSQI